jgi:hypothetical protein
MVTIEIFAILMHPKSLEASKVLLFNLCQRLIRG